MPYHSNRYYGLLLILLIFSPAVRAERVPGRYIVELNTEPVAALMPRRAGRVRIDEPAAVAHRARVRAEQRDIQLQLERRQARVRDHVETVANALFVEIADNAAAQLAATPGVKRVLPVRTFHMVLDQAVVLHKVTEAWNQVGSQHAGEGVKIAIIDSGIDSAHAGFQDATLAAPPSFPRARSDADLPYTSGKIIVARSYVDLLPHRDPDPSARDRVGHGTALAMIAAGVRNAGPLATITGVAPRAYLGNYKVFGTPGFNDSTTDEAILKAIDDAVADGMDIINLSLGDDVAPRLTDDLEAQAVERAAQAGVLVVAAAGNGGPDLNTIASPATAPSAIAVGATTNSRTFAGSVEIAGMPPFVAVPDDGPAPGAPLTGPVADVAKLDGDGLACSPFAANSLQGRVALIRRGTCTFETKLNHAQQAGGVAAVIYAVQDSPDPITMAVGTATLPAEMIGYDDGMAIELGLESQSSLTATLRFTRDAVPIAANRLADFSAAGPNVDLGIKPDLLAAGTDVYTATQTLDERGDMYDPSGYIAVDGTSFSTPLVAGAAALLKSARAGLTVDQYRSLLVNSAAPAQTRSGQPPEVQQQGGGLLDVDAALNSTVTAFPASLSFGAGSADPRIDRVLTLSNIGTAAETFVISAAPRGDGPAPDIQPASVTIAAGASAAVPVSWHADGLAPGAYQGTLSIWGATSGTRISLPYWYAVTGEPARIHIADSLDSGRRGSFQTDAILFRVTDASGLPLPDSQPQVTAVSGDGSVRPVVSRDADAPGLFSIDVQLGPAAGPNVFRIQAGKASIDVSITGR